MPKVKKGESLPAASKKTAVKDKTPEKKEKKKAVLAPKEVKVKVKKEVTPKIPKEAKDPEFVEQLSASGEVELVDKNKFPYEVICSVCGSIRYVNKSGLLTVDKCKLHAKKARRKNRVMAVRNKVAKYGLAVKDAIAQKLFSDAFIKKHGLK